MASWREIERIRKSPDEFRGLAARLLLDPGITPWEATFVESITRLTTVKEFSTRQSEKLLQIRDDTESIEVFQGFSVSILVRKCHEARTDLSEDDEAWIISLRARNSASIKRREIGHLIRCARQLDLVEGHEVPA